MLVQHPLNSGRQKRIGGYLRILNRSAPHLSVYCVSGAEENQVYKWTRMSSML